MGFRKDLAFAAFEGIFYSEDAPPVDWVDQPTKEDGEWFIETQSPSGKIYRVTIERVA